MAHKFSELEKKMSKKALEKSQALADAYIQQMALDELREARKLTQVQLAQSLKVDQGSVSKLERRADMYVSTLRNFIRAMGGELHIRADFPEGSVEIRQFEERVSAKTGKTGSTPNR